MTWENQIFLFINQILTNQGSGNMERRKGLRGVAGVKQVGQGCYRSGWKDDGDEDEIAGEDETALMNLIWTIPFL